MKIIVKFTNPTKVNAKEVPVKIKTIQSQASKQSRLNGLCNNIPSTTLIHPLSIVRSVYCSIIPDIRDIIATLIQAPPAVSRM